MKKVVVLGGGTGTFTVLTGLKNYHLDISVIVSMMDSGGSTGLLRDQLGVLPPGDLRQCLVALSSAPDIWRKLFLYRFENGDLKGHNFGNIFITALEKTSEDYNEVVDTTSILLQTSGKVIPVTLDKAHLCVEYEDGTILEKEGIIDNSEHVECKIKKAYLKPEAKLNKKALKAIEDCDFLIIGPGDLYTSLIPNLLVKGFKKIIKESKCKIIYINNLMTKRGQTTNYKASEHVSDLEKYLGRNIDTVLINTAAIPEEGVRRYKEMSNDIPVTDDLKDDSRVVRADLISNAILGSSKADAVSRSLVRHDSFKLARTLMDYMENSTELKESLTGFLRDVKSLILD